jgi:hypothetical protein
MTKQKIWLYLDDVRQPIEDNDRWQVVRSYDEFVSHIKLNGLDAYAYMTLDHDLGDTSIKEYYNNVLPNYSLDYNNIEEKTGLDCAKWLVQYYYANFAEEAKRSSEEKKLGGVTFPKVFTHSANPIGSANIMGYINNFYRNERQPQSCIRVQIDHTRIDL